MATGQRIKLYRNKLKWTLENLSERSGVDVGTISALENRDSARSKYFPQIAKAFNLSVDQLSDERTEWPVYDDDPMATMRTEDRQHTERSGYPSTYHLAVELAHLLDTAPDQRTKLNAFVRAVTAIQEVLDHPGR